MMLDTDEREKCIKETIDKMTQNQTKEKRMSNKNSGKQFKFDDVKAIRKIMINISDTSDYYDMTCSMNPKNSKLLRSFNVNNINMVMNWMKALDRVAYVSCLGNDRIDRESGDEGYYQCGDCYYRLFAMEDNLENKRKTMIDYADSHIENIQTLGTAKFEKAFGYSCIVSRTYPECTKDIINKSDTFVASLYNKLSETGKYLVIRGTVSEKEYASNETTINAPGMSSTAIIDIEKAVALGYHVLAIKMRTRNDLLNVYMTGKNLQCPVKYLASGVSYKEILVAIKAHPELFPNKYDQAIMLRMLDRNAL
jgi:hypothetical protein